MAGDAPERPGTGVSEVLTGQHGEALFRLAVEASPSAMVVVDQKGEIRLVNQQAERLFGYPRGEMLGQRVEMLVPLRNRERHPAMRGGYLSHPDTRPMGSGRDLYGLTKDGREVPIEIGLNPLKTEEGTFILASIIDITERKRSEERLLQVIEAAPNAMVMVAEDGRIGLVNAQTEKLFGYTRDELIGQRIEMLVPQRNRGQHPRQREGYFKDPSTRSMGIGRDLFGLTKDGREVPIEIGLNPMKSEGGTYVLASIIDITERKRVEDAVRRSEARFRLMVSSVKDYAILMLDAQGFIASWNDGAQRLKGYTEAEAIGLHFSSFYLAEDIASGRPDSELMQAREQGRLEDEGWRQRKDGSRFWASVIITPMYDENGVLTGYSKVTRDITERKRSEERFRLVVEAAPNAMIMVDAEGRITLVNAQTENLFGYPRNELIGRPVEMLVPQGHRYGHPDLRQSYFARPLTRSMGVGRDLFGQTKDGRQVPIEIGLNPIETSDGLFVLASIIDITERKRAEERFRMVVEAAPNAMIMVDSRGLISLVNAQTEKLFGYQREELIGSPVEMLVPQGHRHGHPDLRQSYFGKPLTRSMGVGRDLFGQTKDGRQVPIEIGLNPITTAEGLFVLASIIDITERKRGELELRTLNQTLALQIDETTAALGKLQVAQGQLVQAEKLASLGSLVAGIAHEINTPVGIGVTAASHLDMEVRSMDQAVAAGSLTKSQFERFRQSVAQSSDIILMNLRRAAELIQSFKRVAVDQSSDERRRIRVKAYFEEVLVSLRPKMKATPHRIELECPENLELDTIPGAWSQVLTNLLVNALSHAFEPGKPGLMRIAVDRDDAEVRVRFHDDGRGIPADNIGKIFDPFFTTRRGQGGTGLGLHIVFNIVHQTLGGSIAVNSSPGAGTCFTISLPLAPPHGREV